MRGAYLEKLCVRTHNCWLAPRCQQYFFITFTVSAYTCQLTFHKDEKALQSISQLVIVCIKYRCRALYRNLAVCGDCNDARCALVAELQASKQTLHKQTRAILMQQLPTRRIVKTSAPQPPPPRRMLFQCTLLTLSNQFVRANEKFLRCQKIN